MPDQTAPEPIARPLTIVSHLLNETANVYSMAIGNPVIIPAYTIEIQAVDENDELIFDSIPLHEEDGSPSLDDEGEPLVALNPRMVTQDVEEELLGYANDEDFVFAADDPRWFHNGVRRPHDEVAAEQREIIKEALAERAAKAAAGVQAAQEAITSLPGAGQEL